jgi:hypothetical protein
MAAKKGFIWINGVSRQGHLCRLENLERCRGCIARLSGLTNASMPVTTASLTKLPLSKGIFHNATGIIMIIETKYCRIAPFKCTADIKNDLAWDIWRGYCQDDKIGSS